MRIIAGLHRGRRLKAPKGTATRPTTDRVREALFSVLASLMGNDLGCAAVLDPFAGSGALGLEALSRGCARATFMETDRGALSALRDNIAVLGVEQRARVLASDAFSQAGRGVGGGPFALILLDPPYTLDQTLVARMLESLLAGGAVQPGAVVTWEHQKGQGPPWPSGFTVLQSRVYGSTQIDIAVAEGSDGSQ